MFDAGTVVFLAQFTANHDRMLFPGTVIEADEHTFVVRFAEAVHPGSGSDVLVYGPVENKFVRQPAAIVALRQGDGEPIIAFRPTADAVSVEKRMHARVAVRSLGMYARVGRTPKCLVLDLSPEGFAAVSAHEYAVGETIDVALTYPGLTCSGRARVQTKTALPDGTWRYGFLSADPRSSMRRMLGHITASVQRRQSEGCCQTA